jgi:hypothetical protein
MSVAVRPMALLCELGVFLVGDLIVAVFVSHLDDCGDVEACGAFLSTRLLLVSMDVTADYRNHLPVTTS